MGGIGGGVVCKLTPTSKAWAECIVHPCDGSGIDSQSPAAHGGKPGRFGRRERLPADPLPAIRVAVPRKARSIPAVMLALVLIATIYSGGEGNLDVGEA